MIFRLSLIEEKTMRIEEGIAMSNDVVTVEKLPLPVVYYPGIYSAYFAFSKDKKSQLFLCSCAYESIENHIKLNLRYKAKYEYSKTSFFALTTSIFPSKLFEGIEIDSLPNSLQVMKLIKFKNKICHECNKKVPKYKFCHEMYGGSFKQKYGWYIQKQYYEFGLYPSANMWIEEICPQDILDLIKINPDSIRQLSSLESQGKKEEHEKLLNEVTLQSFGEIPYPENPRWYLYSEFGKQKRKIHNIVENVVREKFGFKKVGEAWTSETILYYIVKSLFKERTIFRHYRPKFLEGLELDIFIEELNLAIEYQGIQHFKPIKHWGGENSYKKLKKRDIKKKQICDSLGIRLLYFNYDEELNEILVKQKINLIINSK